MGTLYREVRKPFIFARAVPVLYAGGDEHHIAGELAPGPPGSTPDTSPGRWCTAESARRPAGLLITAVGLVISCSETFEELFPGKFAYAQWAVLFSGASLLISNFGLSKIIEFSAPVLYFLYPLAIVLILLGLFGRFFGHARTSTGGPWEPRWLRRSWSCAGWWGSSPRLTRVAASPLLHLRAWLDDSSGSRLCFGNDLEKIA